MPPSGDIDDRRAAHDLESPIPGHPSNRDSELIRQFLRTMDLPDDKNYVVHFSAFLDAQRIYVRRYPVYLDEPIRSMGYRGALVQARTCMERIWVKTFISKPKTALPKLDDSYDALNYIVHFITQSLSRNDGTWNWGDKR